MLSPDVHHPVVHDLTEQFDSIVEAGTPYAAEANSASPVAGELQNVRTFDPKELPEGALLIPKDPTNPNLPRIPEVSPTNHETAAKIGYISVDPDAPNIIVLTGPDNEQRRLFTLRPRAPIIKWFTDNMGYQLTGNATDHIIERTPARHVLRDEQPTTPAEAPEEPAIAQIQKEQTVTTPVVHVEQSPTPAEEQRHWFEPYQPAPYPETDKVVSGSHFRSISEALAGENNTSAPAVPEVAPQAVAGVKEFQPGDWRETAQQKHASEAKPLPLSEQLVGIDHALAAVKSLLVGGKYQFTREQVEAAVKDIGDATRWHDAFPIQKEFPRNGEKIKPIFHPFSWETKIVIHAALNAVKDITPTPVGLQERIQELTARPRHELTTDEERRLTRLQHLQRVAPVAEAIRQQPTILGISEEAPSIEVEAIVTPNSSNPTRLLPTGWIDEPLPRSAQAPTEILGPPTPSAFKQLAKKGMSLVNRGIAKLKNLRGRRQIVNA